MENLKKLSSKNQLRTKEEIALAELRSQLEDLTNEKNYGNLKLTDDIYLLAWLKHFNFKVNRAEKGLRDTIQWRRENNIDGLVTQDLDPELSKDFRIYLDSKTKDGLPIVIVCVDDLIKYEKSRVLQHCNHIFAKFENLILDYNHRRYEEMCDRENKRVSITAETFVGGMAIIDCKTFHLTDLRSPKVLQMCLGATRAAMNYFPGLASSAYFINMNRFFDVCFKLIKPIMSVANMRLETFDSNQDKWKPALLSFIKEEDLPEECGGKKMHT